MIKFDEQHIVKHIQLSFIGQQIMTFIDYYIHSNKSFYFIRINHLDCFVEN